MRLLLYKREGLTISLQCCANCTICSVKDIINLDMVCQNQIHTKGG